MNAPQSPETRNIQLGPLAHLVGSWEGIYGEESEESRSKTGSTSYRETITFEAIGPVDTGSEMLYGLRSSTLAWAYGESDEEPIHEELGYWFWCPKEQRIIRCFTNHSGVAINAAGTCAPDAERFEIAAEAGAEQYGISSTPSLNRNCRTLSYRMALSIEDANTLSYQEEIRLENTDTQEQVVHRDHNKLAKVY
ncbi:heme-binding beta-barrel domain-containing protein [Motiliproteus sp. SC1-56]|uniref:heme-binding beta-barrel domain-containing protein n=1 Tax=Motiliproteus sp. SC1-56 TaxID=2799565 RepID=UPI001A8E6BE2|nr:heme-binding beta-barrel domain-containing protein [Motiliproteus sp. SC1-56]